KNVTFGADLVFRDIIKNVSNFCKFYLAQGFEFAVGLIYKFNKNNAEYKRKILAGVIASTAAIAVVVVSVTAFSNLTFAFAVKYGGEVIGYVSEEETFYKAKDMMCGLISAEEPQNFVYEPKFSNSLIGKNKFSSVEDLAVAALKETKELTEAYGLFVDNQLFVAHNDQEYIQAKLDELLLSGKRSENDSADFLQTVEISTAYATVEEVENTSFVDEIFAAKKRPITVKVTALENYEETVAYNVSNVEDDKKLVGYQKVKTQGQNGLKNVTAMVTYIDGVEIERVIEAEEIIAEPVDEIVVNGISTIKTNTQPHRLSGVAEPTTNGGTMIWPVANVGNVYISSYFGDGRGHKGIDICGAYGADVFAAKGGKVVLSQWYYGYGNCIIVEHDDGTQTLYGHNSKLYATVGQEVSGGQAIAAIGSTGNSTGNHLHFEVIVNGVNVNPLRYVKK
ncbi:MAG: peptidoglycan DD-metalloendopeptidase family protein, partial [Oscillospiraceae bacterium]